MNEHLATTLTVYYIILLSMVLCFSSYWFITPNKLIRIQKKSIFSDIRFWIPCLLYTILLGYRWDFAYDWWQYYQTFEYIQRDQLYRDDTEKGYLLINYLLGKAGLDFYSIFLLECFTFFTAIYLLLKHNRKALFIGLCLTFIAMRFRCLNLSRQHFAMSILWIGYYFLSKNKLKTYWIYAVTACSVHTSAILWVIPFYLTRYLRNFISFKPALIIFISCYIFKTIVFELMIKSTSFIAAYIITNKGYNSSTILADRFIWEPSSSFHTALNFIKGLAYVVCMYYVINKKYITDRKDYIILVIGYIGLCLTIFGTTHEIISRFMLYVSAFTFIGWGVIWKFLIQKRKTTPIWIWILALFTIMHYIYAMYPTIVTEWKNGVYIEYKNDAFPI